MWNLKVDKRTFSEFVLTRYLKPISNHSSDSPSYAYMPILTAGITQGNSKFALCNLEIA